MAVRSDNRLWVRKLDGDIHVVDEQPMTRLYPANLDQVVESVTAAMNPPLGGQRQARAVGSHWGISHTGVTTGYMIETATPVHEPDGDQAATRLNAALYDVVPACLSPDALAFFYRQDVPTFNPAVMPTHQEIYLFHVEAGMRIHELYALLDEGDAGKGKTSLADRMKDQGAPNDYSGPWALETMGGAGGQTIAGAFSTATHGGDVLLGPIGESVVAVHLVDGQGKQHWIERTRLRPTALPLKLTDEVRLEARFPKIRHHRDDDLLNAVVVACGRMGVIYSVVLRVVRQFALEQKCTKQDWSDVKTWINGAPLFLFNRFVRIDINPYGGFSHPSRHDCYVITRVMRELDAGGQGNPLGRAERGGQNAGKRPALGKTEGFFDNPCASDNWIRTALNELKSALADIREKAVKIWLACAGAIIFPLTPPALKAKAFAAQQAASVTIAFTTGYIVTIDFLIDHVIPAKAPFGDTVSSLTNYLAHFELFAILRGVIEGIYEDQHADVATTAISYAVMDGEDYLNVGCVAPGDSIEVFIDATDPKLIDFVDLVLIRLRQLENGDLENGSPEAFGGYISLRFMAQSQAHIAMQKWTRTCSIEIAGLSRVEGTEPFLRRIEADAAERGMVLHWGQRNNWSMKDVEAVHYAAGPNGPLFKWRAALSDLTDHGRFDLFSTAFSKQMGLEITDPIIEGFSAVPREGCVDEEANVTWEAIRNPPETQAFLIIKPEQGNPTRISLDSLSGSRNIPLPVGRSVLSLVLERELKWKEQDGGLGGRVYVAQRDIAVRGLSDNDEWAFAFTGEPRPVDGVNRWTAEMNLFSQFISNKLRVSEIHTTFSGVTSWILRHPDLPDLPFTSAQNHHVLTSAPVFNKHWLFFSELPASPGPNPMLRVVFKCVCQH